MQVVRAEYGTNPGIFGREPPSRRIRLPSRVRIETRWAMTCFISFQVASGFQAG